MTLPNTITSGALAALAAPEETHAVRVVLHKVSSQVPYRLRSKLRTYVFEKDREHGGHVLDVPASVWMDRANQSARRGEGAICNDLQPSINLPLTVLIVPWGKAAKVSNDTACLPVLRKILSFFNPPPVVLKALDLAESNSLPELEALAAKIEADRTKPVEAGEETPAQARARKMREAKAAKKELQPT
jgi:hypothetical protein